ncbi:MAG: RsmE family RNA methyltransferase [Myxococcales bacterium]|nr:RsmE family RNA methyltransferase [Myxococcales bacterium]
MPELRHPYAPIRVAKKLEVGAEIALDAGATKSLRFREVNEKEAFTLRDADGAYFRASVLSLSAERAQVAIYERMLGSPESDARITLVCAVLARQRMLMVAQKATELGVTRILPVFSAHSVNAAGLAHEKAHAWPGQTLRAARQCRRASLPEMRSTIPLERLFDDPVWQEAALRFTLDDRTASGRAGLARARARQADRGGVRGRPRGRLVRRRARAAREEGALPLRLGGRVLRAETAVIVGLTVLQYALGDLSDGR